MKEADSEALVPETIIKSSSQNGDIINDKPFENEKIEDWVARHFPKRVRNKFCSNNPGELNPLLTKCNDQHIESKTIEDIHKNDQDLNNTYEAINIPSIRFTSQKRKHSRHEDIVQSTFNTIRKKYTSIREPVLCKSYKILNQKSSGKPIWRAADYKNHSATIHKFLEELKETEIHEDILLNYLRVNRFNFIRCITEIKNNSQSFHLFLLTSNIIS